jgi:hypothetical protein
MPSLRQYHKNRCAYLLQGHIVSVIDFHSAIWHQWGGQIYFLVATGKISATYI